MRVLTATQLAPTLELLLRASTVPFVTGSPGIAKSAVIREVAESLKLKVIDFRLAQCMPSDLIGLPVAISEEGVSDYLPPKQFPLKNAAIPEGYKGWLIVFEELNACTKTLQAIAYKILWDRMVGNYDLHPNVAMVATGNLVTDRAVVFPLSSAITSRIITLELVSDLDSWVLWAKDNGIHPTIIAFLQFNVESFNTFDPTEGYGAYACSRTWEFASNILYQHDITSLESSVLDCVLQGTVGIAAASNLMDYIALQEGIPSVETILANPDSIDLDNYSFGTVAAISVLVAKLLTPDTMVKLNGLINSFEEEHIIILYSSAFERYPELVEHPMFCTWIGQI